MPAAAASVWNSKYASDLSTACTKLDLGHAAFSSVTQNSTDAAFASLSGTLRDFKGAWENSQKINTKGAASEKKLHQVLQQSGCFSSVQLLTTRDARGKQGGDMLIIDHSENSCVVELKDKKDITDDDVVKFERDAENWVGSAKIFAFVRTTGIGSCRKLHAKPLIDFTPAGKILIWFRGNQDEFVRDVGFIMGLAGVILRKCGADQRVGKALSAAVKGLEQVLADTLSDQAELGKKLLALKKRETYYQALLSSVSSVNTVKEETSPPIKKARLLDAKVAVPVV